MFLLLDLMVYPVKCDKAGQGRMLLILLILFTVSISSTRLSILYMYIIRTWKLAWQRWGCHITCKSNNCANSVFRWWWVPGRLFFPATILWLLFWGNFIDACFFEIKLRRDNLLMILGQSGSVVQLNSLVLTGLRPHTNYAYLFYQMITTQPFSE